jgi:nucleotide-binding universal stress UspA family protein
MRILVPVDFTPRSRAALRYALGLAETTGATVQVLHVVPPPSDVLRRAQAYIGLPESQVTAEVLSHADAELDVLLSSVPHSMPIEKRVISGDAAASVVQIADDEGFDLVVIGSRGRGRLAAAALGSVAHAVMTCARCPVLSLVPHT